jgi:hypothetical protein
VLFRFKNYSSYLNFFQSKQANQMNFLKTFVAFTIFSAIKTHAQTPSQGETVKCNQNVAGAYRYVGGRTIRPYPSRPIAASWDKTFDTKFKTIDCNYYTIGSNMVFNPPDEGDPIKCGPTGVYRYVGNLKLRLYPTPAIATSWDRDWEARSTLIDCAGYKFDTQMTMHVRAPELGQV